MQLTPRPFFLFQCSVAASETKRRFDTWRNYPLLWRKSTQMNLVFHLNVVHSLDMFWNLVLIWGSIFILEIVKVSFPYKNLISVWNFFQGVLKNPQSWGVQFKALFLRCITEFSNSRKAERALQQLESLSLDYKKENPKGSSRQHLIQAVDLDPTWEHQVYRAKHSLHRFLSN